MKTPNKVTTDRWVVNISLASEAGFDGVCDALQQYLDNQHEVFEELSDKERARFEAVQAIQSQLDALQARIAEEQREDEEYNQPCPRHGHGCDC